MQKSKLVLKAGGFLEISEGYVRYVDCGGREGHLTPAQQAVLAKLAQAKGSPVPYSQLFEAYSGQTSVGNVNQYLTKIRNRIESPELKKCIRAVSGVGYRLDMAQFEAEPAEEVHRTAQQPAEESLWARKLVGDYYGFYLDAVGDNTILGTYVHIEERGGVICASAILGIQSDEVLRNEKLHGIFLDPQKRYYQNYRSVIAEFSDNDQRCFFAEGTVTTHNRVAVITMKTDANSSWTILMEVSGFLDIDRLRVGMYHPYRGGMGILVALTQGHGNFCARFGMIRKECMQPTIVLDNPRLKEFIKIFGDVDDEGKEKFNSCSPLSLDRDRKWYNWFMKGAKTE